MAYPTTIAAGTHVAGSIQASEDIAVEGSVQGTISLSEVLIVAPGGVVHGDIQARVAQIDGVVVGTIQATERILLGPTARVQATITSPLLEMNDGAQLAGELNIGVDGEAPAPARTTASTTSRSSSTAPTTSRAIPTASSSRTATPARTTTPAPSAPQSTTPASVATQAASVTQPAAAAVTTVVEEEQEQPVEVATPAAPEESEASIEKKEPEKAQANAEADAITFQELDDDYTVKELREELRRRDLPVTGSKSELIERLLEAESQSN